MQNHVRNMMELEKDFAMNGCKVVGVFVPKCSQKHGKE